MRCVAMSDAKGYPMLTPSQWAEFDMTVRKAIRPTLRLFASKEDADRFAKDWVKASIDGSQS